MPAPRKKAAFVKPMECVPVSKLPDGSKWLWELKLDGYRAIGFKSGGKVQLYSRNSKPFDKKSAYIAEALSELPDETTVDGEIVALDDDGRPRFNLLQNFVRRRGEACEHTKSAHFLRIRSPLSDPACSSVIGQPTSLTDQKLPETVRL